MVALILVVDDEPGIRSHACQVLEDVGYTTVAAASAGEAKEVFSLTREDARNSSESGGVSTLWGKSARGESRTRTGLPPVDFESTASAIPPLGPVRVT